MTLRNAGGPAHYSRRRQSLMRFLVEFLTILISVSDSQPARFIIKAGIIAEFKIHTSTAATSVP
jgi:hypothetical protein